MQLNGWTKKSEDDFCPALNNDQSVLVIFHYLIGGFEENLRWLDPFDCRKVNVKSLMS